MFSDNKSKVKNLIIGSDKIVDPITVAVKELEAKNQGIVELDALIADEVQERLEHRADLKTQLDINRGRIERLKAVL